MSRPVGHARDCACGRCEGRRAKARAAGRRRWVEKRDDLAWRDRERARSRLLARQRSAALREAADEAEAGQ